MKKNNCLKTALAFLLLIVSAADAASQSNDLNKLIPVAASQALKRANKLAERGKFAEAAAELKKAIAAAPNFVQAHERYIYFKSYFLEQTNQVKADYETLMKKNLDNPVYPMAMAMGLFIEPQATKNKWLEAVVKLAPEWVWGY